MGMVRDLLRHDAAGEAGQCREFVGADAAQDGVAGQHFGEACDDGLENAVAHMVAQPFVDLPELIDVETEDDVGHVAAGKPDRHFAIALLQEGAAGQQTGKRIVIGQETGTFLRRVAVRHVPRDADEGDLVAEPHLTHAEMDRNDRTVLALRQHFAARADYLGPARRHVVVDIGGVPVLVGSRHQHGDGSADQLDLVIAEHLAAGPVDRLDDAPGVDRQDAVHRRVEQRRHELFPPQQDVQRPLAVGHVLDRGDVTDDRSAGIGMRDEEAGNLGRARGRRRDREAECHGFAGQDAGFQRFDPAACLLAHDGRKRRRSVGRRIETEDPHEVGIGEPRRPVQPEIRKALG